MDRNPLFNGLPGKYGDPKLDALAEQAARLADEILGSWAEKKLKEIDQRGTVA